MATTSIHHVRKNDASVQVTLSTEALYRPTVGNRASWIVSTIWNGCKEWVRLYSRDIDLLEQHTGQTFSRDQSFTLPDALTIELCEAIPSGYGTLTRLCGIKAIVTEKPVAALDYHPGAVLR